MTKMEFQRLLQPLYCPVHKGIWVAHIEDIVEGEADDDGEYMGTTYRRFTCAAEGCNRLLKVIKIN